jgi:hypothetical protein
MFHENGYHYIVDDTGKALYWREDILARRIVNSITGQCLNPWVNEAENRAGHRRRLRDGFRPDPPGSIRCGETLYRKLGLEGPVSRGFDIGPVRRG